MSATVDVLPNGMLQLTADGMTFAPMTVASVQALAAKIPDAQNAAARTTTTNAMQGLVTALSTSHADMTATVTATATSVDAVVDAATFGELQQSMGLIPDTAGALTAGPVTITQQPAPAPTTPVTTP